MKFVITWSDENLRLFFSLLRTKRNSNLELYVVIKLNNTLTSLWRWIFSLFVYELCWDDKFGLAISQLTLSWGSREACMRVRSTLSLSRCSHHSSPVYIWISIGKQNAPAGVRTFSKSRGQRRWSEKKASFLKQKFCSYSSQVQLRQEIFHGNGKNIQLFLRLNHFANIVQSHPTFLLYPPSFFLRRNSSRRRRQLSLSLLRK